MLKHKLISYLNLIHSFRRTPALDQVNYNKVNIYSSLFFFSLFYDLVMIFK